QRHRVVAEAQHERVQRRVLTTSHVNGVRQDQTPARACVPRILCERLEPHLRIAEPLPRRREEEVEPEVRVRQRYRAYRENYDEQEQARYEETCRGLDAAHAARNDEDADRERKRLKSDCAPRV